MNIAQGGDLSAALQERHDGEHPLSYYVNGHKILTDVASGLCELHARRVRLGQYSHVTACAWPAWPTDLLWARHSRRCPNLDASSSHLQL